MINALPEGVEGSTRDRLLAAGIRLFAERGFQATTVGEIESAAGLQPRRGALYHYFPTKQALLEAAVQTHLTVIEHGRRQMEGLPGADVRTEALLIGRWFLAELDAERYLVHILEQDGDRLPEIRELIRERIIDAGHQTVEHVLRRRLGRRAARLDTKALAVMLIAPLANARRVTWTFGAPPLGIDDDTLLSTWADAIALLSQHLGVASRGGRTGRADR